MSAATLLPLVNVYVHGTYQSAGQWTCRPDRVVLVVGGGVGTAGGGGKKVLSVVVTSIVTESSMCDGFRCFSDTTVCTSCLLLTPTENVLAPRSMTL